MPNPEATLRERLLNLARAHEELERDACEHGCAPRICVCASLEPALLREAAAALEVAETQALAFDVVQSERDALYARALSAESKLAEIEKENADYVNVALDDTEANYAIPPAVYEFVQARDLKWRADIDRANAAESKLQALREACAPFVQFHRALGWLNKERTNTLPFPKIRNNYDPADPRMYIDAALPNCFELVRFVGSVPYENNIDGVAKLTVRDLRALAKEAGDARETHSAPVPEQ